MMISNFHSLSLSFSVLYQCNEGLKARMKEIGSFLVIFGPTPRFGPTRHTWGKSVTQFCNISMMISNFRCLSLYSINVVKLSKQE